MLQPDSRGMTDPLESANSSVSSSAPNLASPSASAAKDSPVVAPPPPAPSSPGFLQRLWTLVVRLLILGMGVSVGWLAGLLVAQVWPSRNPNPPIQERVMRQASQTVRKVRQLPQWWAGEAPATAGANLEPSSAADTSPVTPNDAPSPPSTLSQEVVALQQELTSLETRLAELEQQTGQPGTGDLATRLQQLAQQAAAGENPTTAPSPVPTEDAAESATEEGATEEGAAAPRPVDEASDGSGASAPTTTAEDPSTADDGLGRYAATLPTPSPFPLVSNRIGLPSALLFEPDSSLLTPAGQQLLDAIVPDLRRFGAVTFLVGSHTDGALSAPEARRLTFQQSLAIQSYLAAQLGDTNSRWLAVGYGKTRPVALGNAPGTEARNQRVDIGIIRP